MVKTIDFQMHGDERGSLIALEYLKEIPFEIRRIYYIFGTLPDVERGFHAHYKLKQVAICVSGHCTFILDDGRTRQEVLLDSPRRGLLIEDLTWREMKNFSPDCVLLVLADQLYDEKDYIRDYNSFLKFAAKGK